MTPAPEPAPELFRIPARRVPEILAGISVFLLLLHIALQGFSYGVARISWLYTELFNVDQELSVPTWYSVMLLLICAVLLLAVARRTQHERGPFVRHWYGLAVGFFFASIDELAGFHETLNTALGSLSWTIPAAILVAVLFAIYLKFLIRLPARTRWGFLFAAGVYLAGALGLEYVSDFYVYAHGMRNFGYQLFTAAEEGLEMMGLVLFVRALLRHLGREGGVLLLATIEPAGRPPRLPAGQ